jgi:8-oxo-dGTP pyrophosphatase MutT (NUDIX family)
MDWDDPGTTKGIGGAEAGSTSIPVWRKIHSEVWKVGGAVRLVRHANTDKSCIYGRDGVSMIEIAVAVVIDSSGRTPGGEGSGDRVLVSRRRAGAPRGGLWEFPGGKIEPAESPAVAAVREAFEETGCEIDVLAPLAISEEVDPREVAEPAVRLHAFLARSRPGGAPARAIASDEVRWVDLDELRSLPMPGGNRAIVEALIDRVRMLAGGEDPETPLAAVEIEVLGTTVPSPWAKSSLLAWTLLPLLALASRGLAASPGSITLPIGSTPLSVAFEGALKQDGTPEAPAASAGTALSTPDFGAAGTWRANLLGGVISDFSTTTGGEFRAEFEYFLVDRFSLVPTFEIGGFVQDGGDDPLLVSGALLLRWHFLEGKGWTVFANADVDAAYLTGDLPPGTNSIKFSPQIGAGFTLELAEGSATRLIGGVRWYHLSNARTAESNDGFDGAEAYLGLSFPF